MVVKKCIVCGAFFDAQRNTITCSDKCRKERIQKRQKEYYKQWYENNKEKIQEYHRKYREHNREQMRKCWRKNSQKYYRHNSLIYSGYSVW